MLQKSSQKREKTPHWEIPPAALDIKIGLGAQYVLQELHFAPSRIDFRLQIVSYTTPKPIIMITISDIFFMIFAPHISYEPDNHTQQKVTSL